MTYEVKFYNPRDLVLDARPAMSNSSNDIMQILIETSAKSRDDDRGLTEVIENICINELALRN